MRRLAVLALAVALAPAAWAKVGITVYRCDGVTPLEAVDPNHPTVYRDVMVGTRLVIVVSSDKGEYWRGSLLLSDDEAQRATLSGRGYVAIPSNYKDSCLVSAGYNARAIPFADSTGVGIDLSTSPSLPVLPGDWFVIDYYAQWIGTCNVGLYDLSVSHDVPIETFSFTQVPARDFNGDTAVDFKDLALLALHWSSNGDPNGPDAAFDLNSDGHTDLGDLALFSEYWLERTDCATSL